MRAVKTLSVAVALMVAACGPKVASIEVTPKTVDLSKKADAVTLVATPKDAQGNKIENLALAWSSGDAKVATVDNGKVAAVDSGETQIKVTFEQISATVPVKISIPASISFAPAAVTLEGLGSKAHVTAKVMDSKGKEVKGAKLAWSAADAKIASVNGGEITAMAAGETQIVAQVGDLKGQVKVTVAVPVPATVEAEKNLEIKAGETAPLKPVVKDAEGKELAAAALTFVSADEKIATVDAAGVVKAVAKGKTRVTITAGDKTATVEIKVKK
ncbi:MAG: Ig-like domain-containing protein [Deltaproteobacteria bacterium]|nr:Ig-like domain-containing protein [Deltaproteobacteria bacterium]